MDFVQEFIADMMARGICPSDHADIIPDDRVHRFRVDGDRNRNAVYQLRVDDGFAVGWYLWFKEGETHRWHSSLRNNLSAQEKEALRARIKRLRSKQDDELQAKQAAAVIIANSRWAVAAQSGVTDYMRRKKVGLHNARIHNGALYIPIYDGRSIVNLQKIYPDGRKLFIPGGKKKGCYSALTAQGDDRSIIYICEGWATAASVREATSAPVIVAFDAGNLEPVALVFREKYPESTIIIAADNDQWSVRADGRPFNVGIEKGRKAAEACGGKLIFPNFPPDDTERGTDFNDLHCRYSLDAVKSRLGDACLREPSLESPNPKAGIPVLQHDWRELLIFTNAKDPKIKSNSMYNASLFLKHHEKFRDIFIYDAFSHRIIVNRCPPWESPDNFQVQAFDDIHVTKLTAELERHEIFLPLTNVCKVVESIANENFVHPARDYFNDLEWDKLSRLDNWLYRYMGCTKEPREYLSFVGKKWMTAAVKRVFVPGCKFDHVLVMEGEQGKGKSMLLRELATFGEEKQVSYFTDNISITDISNKDTIMKMQGSIICELAELQGFNKKDDNEIKNWITNQHDDCRLPYSRSIKRFDRQFVLAATTNDTEYLKDPTGNRRYWPVSVGNIDIEGIRRDRTQLWAEAVHWYKEGLYIGPTPEEMKLAEQQQKARLYYDEWSGPVLAYARGESRIKMFDIFEHALRMGARDINRASERRVANILKLAGYETTTGYDAETGRTERFWRKAEEGVKEEELPW